jgi:hypothetical protein
VNSVPVPSNRAAWLRLAGAWALVVPGLILWIGLTSPHTLREHLKTAQFWSLELCVVAGVVLACLNWRDLWGLLGRHHGVRILAVMALGVALTLFMAPRTNRIYYDEQIYQSIGHNMTDLRLAQMCLDGTVQYGRLECAAGEYNKQPYAYPHLLSLLYRVGGVGPGWAFAANATAMALTVAAVYLVVLLLFGDLTAALCAALIIALTPHQILWSATAAVEPLASFACVSAVAAVGLFAHTRTTAALALAGVATVYAVQFRPESFLIVPVVGLLLLHLAPEEFKERRVWWVGLACVALLAVHVAHLYSVRNEGWGTTESRFALQYVAPNFRVNGRFYVFDERFPVVYTVLAVAGLTVAAFALRRIAMLVYFGLFFVLGLFFYAGSYNYGADVRYSVMTYPPLAVLAGLGASQLALLMTRWHPLRVARWAVAAGLAFQFLWYAPLVRATTEEAWAARADVTFAELVAPTLPSNSLVLTHNPGMFHLWGVNAAQMFLVVDNPARLQFLATRYAGGVYLHWNFWCNVADPVQQDMCRRVAAMGPTEVFREYREQDQRFVFMRLMPPDPQRERQRIEGDRQ